MHTLSSESEPVARLYLLELKKINLLPINDRFKQCVSLMTFKSFNNLSPSYANGVFKPAGHYTVNTILCSN